MALRQRPELLVKVTGARFQALTPTLQLPDPDTELRYFAQAPANAATEAQRVQAAPTDVAANSSYLSSGVVAASGQVDATEVGAARTDVNELPGDVPDGALLERFVADRDQPAFTGFLVARHERLVRGICQGVLGDSHTAEDAFQTTFMVLARKASMLDKHRSLASWLYKVAYHLALRFRAVAGRQRRCETHAARVRAAQGGQDGTADIEKQEIHQALREEVQRLPEKYRVPLVLCYFDGRTHDEVARTIGLPRGSIAKRIGEGLQHLRQRLIERGVML